jgi:hypothetical protein
LPQQGAALIGQEPWPVQPLPHPDWGQLAAHWDAPSVPWAHAPVQFSRHPAGPQESLAGQVHDPACPKVDPIPAISRTIEIIAIFFILVSPFIY